MDPKKLNNVIYTLFDVLRWCKKSPTINEDPPNVFDISGSNNVLPFDKYR